MNYKIFLEKIKAAIIDLSDLSQWGVITAEEYIDERLSKMAIIGFEGLEQMHPFLNDYKLSFSITLDSYIADDEQGFFIAQKYEQIINFLFSKINRKDFEWVDDGDKVVGLIYVSTDSGSTETSEYKSINFDIVISY